MYADLALDLYVAYCPAQTGFTRVGQIAVVMCWGVALRKNSVAEILTKWDKLKSCGLHCCTVFVDCDLIQTEIRYQQTYITIVRKHDKNFCGQ